MTEGGISLNNTWGVLFITSLVASMLWGASVVQLYIYYSSFWKRDRVLLKAFIFVTWSLDTSGLLLLLTGTYEVFVSDFGNLASLLHIGMQLKVMGYITGITNLLCQVFYTRNIWIMSKNCIALTLACGFLVAAQFIHTVVYNTQILKTDLITGFESRYFEKIEKGLSIVVVVTDTFLAVTMIALLAKERNGYKRTNSILHRIILYILGSGFIGGVLEIISIICAFVIPKTFWYFAPATLLPRLYMNSILALLNSRRSSIESSDQTTFDAKTVFLAKTSQGSLTV